MNRVRKKRVRDNLWAWMTWRGSGSTPLNADAGVPTPREETSRGTTKHALYAQLALEFEAGVFALPGTFNGNAMP